MLTQDFSRWDSPYPWLLLVVGCAWLGWQLWQRRHADQCWIAGQTSVPPLPALASWPTQPVVSVLVAAWNEEAYLADFLCSFAALTYPHKELILCAGGSDQTYQIAQQWTGCAITLLSQQEGEGKYQALQRSLAHARGTIIFLTDADCVLHDDSFQRLIYPLVTGSEAVVTGTFQPLLQQRRLPFVTAQWLMQQARQRRTTTTITYSNFLVGANSALTRTLVETCWQASLDNAIGEDYHLALEIQRRGIQIRQCLESQVQTRYPNTFHKYLMTKSRWHRSWLLHHYRQGDRRWVRNGLSAGRFQLLLALPLLPLLLGAVGVVIWLVLWAHQFIQYWLNKELVAKAAEGHHTDRVQIQHLFLLMLADFSSWAIIPFQLVIPQWRRQW